MIDTKNCTMQPAPGDITSLLRKMTCAPLASAKLMPMIHQDIRKIANAQFRREGINLSLQLTEVVDEAFLKLLKPGAQDWKSRSHFFGAMANAVRQTLVDHARTRNAKKRPGQWLQVELRADAAITEEDHTLVLTVNAALERLAKFAPRQSHVVELRFFGGLSIQETADVLQLHPSTIKSDWLAASAWLRRELEAAFDPRTME